jgi:hypothetical protein
MITRPNDGAFASGCNFEPHCTWSKSLTRVIAMRMQKIPFVLSVLVLLLATFLAWVALLPRPARPNLSFRILGYTNDSSGTLLAMIAASNRSTFSTLIYHPAIEIILPGQPAAFTNFQSVRWTPSYLQLGAGMSGIFTIPPPTNQSPWRILCYAYTDLDTAQVIKRFVTRRRHMPFDVQSDWIESKETNTVRP